MFPMPHCESCGARGRCEATSVTRPEYPRCRMPLRDVDLGRTLSLLEWLAAAEGVDGSTATALHGPLLSRYATDRHERPDVLEPSFSCDAAGTHLYRFSYAFPTIRRERDAVERVLLDTCRPFGAHVVEAASTVLRAAPSRAFEQILFGYAHGRGSAAARVKLYVQFVAGESEIALDVAGRLLGRSPTEIARPEPLHLLCLDMGSEGVSGTKLYFWFDRIGLDDLERRLGPVPLATALRNLGVAELREVLAIHRLSGPEDASASRAAEIDFPLEINGLRWLDVRALPPVRALLERSPSVAMLERSFRLAVRRIKLEPALRPLLEAMQRESQGRGTARVFSDPPPATGEYGLANMIRAHLEAAGIEREELRVRTKTSRWIVFHDLRATGAVWRFKRNGPEDTITDVMEDGGWGGLGTMQKYLRLARYMTGTAFPQLPKRLLAGPDFIRVQFPIC